MRKTVFLGIIAIFFLSCENSNNTIDEPATLSENNFGGTFRYSEQSLYSSLFPYSFRDMVSSHIVSQIYEGLVKYDPRDLSVVPAIARKWELDSSETVYRFTLRDDVYFHDDSCFENMEGRRITASDVAFSYVLLATKNENNQNFLGTVDQILGAAEHYQNAEKEQIEGITVENDSVISIRIVRPNPLFLYFLANPAAAIIPREAFQKYGYNSLVGSGPFYVSALPEKGSPLVLCRNTNYYKKDKKDNQLPYLDTVLVYFYGSSGKALSLLPKDELDVVFNVENDDVASFLEKNIDLFKGNKPQFVLESSKAIEGSLLQDIVKENIRGLYTNSQSYLDLSLVYFEKTVAESDSAMVQTTN